MDNNAPQRSSNWSQGQGRNRQSSLSSNLANVTNYDDVYEPSNRQEGSEGGEARLTQGTATTFKGPPAASAGPSGLSAEFNSRQGHPVAPINTNIPLQSSSAPSTVGPRAFHSASSPVSSPSANTDRLSKRHSTLSNSPSEGSIAEEREESFDSSSNVSSTAPQDHRPVSVPPSTTAAASALPPSHRLSSTPIFPSPLAQALFDDDLLDNFDINDEAPTTAEDDHVQDHDAAAAFAAAAAAQNQRNLDAAQVFRRRSDAGLSAGRWSSNPRRSPNQSLKGKQRFALPVDFMFFFTWCFAEIYILFILTQNESSPLARPSAHCPRPRRFRRDRLQAA